MKSKLLSKNYQITTSNVDANNVATSKFLLQTFQDVAVLHANHLGFGWDVLNAEKKLWIVSKMSVVVHFPAMLGDEVVVTTWPSQPNKFFADRHFQVRRSDGTLLVEAISRWCIIDFDTRKMSNPAMVSQKYYQGEYLSDVTGATFSSKKVVVDDTFVLAYQRQVRWTDLDLNRHVNNTNYVDYALDCLDESALDDSYTAAFELTYHNECHFGEKLQLFSNVADGNHKVVGQKDNAVCFTYNATYKKL